VRINSASQEEMGRHPYIGFKLAKNIVNYRAKHGPFKSLEDVKKLYSLDAAKLPMLIPYLSFE
jgi:competence ComEA-like helix-hairpin-helix protein